MLVNVEKEKSIKYIRSVIIPTIFSNQITF